MVELEEDRLSSLPKVVLHCIMSKLPEKDAARTSVLSKAWLDTWYTFPILSFTASKFMEMYPVQPIEEDSERMTEISGFCDYVKRSILRFRDQSLAIKEFKLDVDCFGLDNISNDVNICLKLACECGVEVLDYSQTELAGQDKYHVLPMCVNETKSIRKLVLKGHIKIDPTFMNHSIKFSSLRVLTLWCVLFGDENAINHLISFCPLIESINLSYCHVLSSNDRTMEKIKSLSISGLRKLKRVDASGIQDISIDAPSLENLCYHCPINVSNTPLKIDFDRCRNLKQLCIWSVAFTFFKDNWFLEQFPKFPFLESLMLNNCKMVERIDISSIRLKVLKFLYCSNLKEVIIDAPNLLSCEYNGIGASEPTVSFLRNSSQLEVKIQIHVDYVNLCNFREFVQNIKPNNVLTSLCLIIKCSSNVDALDPVALQVSSPPPSIKHLRIFHDSNNKNVISSIVNILLSSCCPATISLRAFPHNKELIELFYETLMRRKEDECFCTSDNTRCWWHGLKDVKVTSSMKMDENVDFKTILESLPDFALEETISFRLDF